MGKRGGTSGKGASTTSSKDYARAGRDWKDISIVEGTQLYMQNKDSYQTDYSAYKRGQISKTDAGQLYKAVKNGDIKALPETTRALYNEADYDIRQADSRYTQDYKYYDAVENLTHALLNKDYNSAQNIVYGIENDAIKRAGKRSAYKKYQTQISQ